MQQGRIQHRVVQRGSAAIELMIAAPMLLICVIAMLDFGRGIRSAQEGERAARYLAWSDARSREDRGHSGTASVSDHYRADGTPAGSSVSRGTIDPWAGPKSVGYAGLRELESLFSLRDVTRDAFAYLAGTVDYSEARTAFRPDGLRLLGGGSVQSRHAVSLGSRREEDPGRPVGWWDPFEGEGGLLDKLPHWIRRPWAPGGGN